MNILTPQTSLPISLTKSVVSIGNFDGVHRGHRTLIETVCDSSRRRGASSLLITFEPHTRTALNPGSPQSILTTFPEKTVLLSRTPLDYLVCLNFDETIGKMKANEFINQILIEKFNAIEWVMGENHRFGYNQNGDVDFLKNLYEDSGKNHFTVFALKLFGEQDAPASSTTIRLLIAQHRMEEAVALLGHPYLVIAQRTEGMKIGTRIGYPTLNFVCSASHKVLPPAGVYAAQIEYGPYQLHGALYFGNCPTFENRDYHFEFYSFDSIVHDPEMGETVCLWIHRAIRQDRQFESVEQLTEQIKSDVACIKNFFNKE
ncbi:MAG: hypothetical protein JW795_01740 [Chitinivibrionales bacterium]|nr:hypothetical protein [Chitinivibrionales bacterium]